MEKLLQIAIVGIDGCGKSSTSRAVFEALGRQKKVAYVGNEYVYPETKYLKFKYWCRATAKNTNSKYLYKVLKIIELILEDNIQQRLIKKHRPQIVVTDGSPLINILAWANIYHPDQLNETTINTCINVFNLSKIDIKNLSYLLKNFPRAILIMCIKRHFVMPGNIVFLDIKPDVALARIDSRNNPKQMHENQASLEKLRNGYKIVCSQYADYTKVTKIEVSTLSFEEVVDKVMNEIDE